MILFLTVYYVKSNETLHFPASWSDRFNGCFFYQVTCPPMPSSPQCSIGIRSHRVNSDFVHYDPVLLNINQKFFKGAFTTHYKILIFLKVYLLYNQQKKIPRMNGLYNSRVSGRCYMGKFFVFAQFQMLPKYT